MECSILFYVKPEEKERFKIFSCSPLSPPLVRGEIERGEERSLAIGSWQLAVGKNLKGLTPPTYVGGVRP